MEERIHTMRDAAHTPLQMCTTHTKAHKSLLNPLKTPQNPNTHACPPAPIHTGVALGPFSASRRCLKVSNASSTLGSDSTPGSTAEPPSLLPLAAGGAAGAPATQMLLLLLGASAQDRAQPQQHAARHTGVALGPFSASRRCLNVANASSTLGSDSTPGSTAEPPSLLPLAAGGAAGALQPKCCSCCWGQVRRTGPSLSSMQPVTQGLHWVHSVH
jgi:hypothetical protein